MACWTHSMYIFLFLTLFFSVFNIYFRLSDQQRWQGCYYCKCSDLTTLLLINSWLEMHMSLIWDRDTAVVVHAEGFLAVALPRINCVTCPHLARGCVCLLHTFPLRDTTMNTLYTHTFSAMHSKNQHFQKKEMFIDFLSIVRIAMATLHTFPRFCLLWLQKRT